MTLPVRPRDRPLRHAAPDRRRRPRPRARATTSSSCTARPRPRSRSRRSSASRPSGRAASTSSSPRSPRRRSARARRRRPSGSPRASTGSASKAAVCIRQPSLGPGLRDQGRRGRRRLQPGHPDGGLQPPPDRRRPRHRRGAQPRRRRSSTTASTTRTRSASTRTGILWPRVLDISDRALRHVVIGLGGREDGVPRETEFVITVGSEVMAVLALATDLARPARAARAGSSSRRRRDGKPVTAEDLGVAGAMTVLLRDAIKPNLLQTLEGGPAFVHCGPFANIAHGNNSIIADRLALATNDIVCTEAGFGADMGAEKFFDIKCRASGLAPDAAVVVATVRALKMHGGVGKIVAGKPLDPALLEENVEAVRLGRPEPRQADRERHACSAIPAVVAINSFPTDTPAEVEAIREVALAAGARDAVVATHFADGGAGAADLAEAVWAAAEDGRAGLPAALPGRDAARRQDRDDRDAGLRRRRRRVPAGRPRSRSSSTRTSASATCRSAWPRPSTRSATTRRSRAARPASRVPIREVRLSAGAGFITPLCGEMRTMPGLPSRAGRREHRHRRRREHRRAVLEPTPAPAASGERRSRARSRPTITSPSHDAEDAGAPGARRRSGRAAPRRARGRRDRGRRRGRRSRGGRPRRRGRARRRRGSVIVRC